MFKKFSVDFKIKLVFLFFTIFLLISYVLIEKYIFFKETSKSTISNAVKKLNERENVFQNFIQDSSNILISLRNTSSFTSYLENLQDKKKEQSLDLFLALANSNKEFMQLRFIDKNGKEQIRIDRKKEAGETFIIPEQKLQNKANRYYFSDSVNKEYEKVWFSALDLNVENGAVEIPYRPTLRAMLPLEVNGEFGGIIIINYFMEGFLKKFSDTVLYETILANNSGFTLIHPDKNKSWGYYQKEKYSLSNEFPNLSNKILEGKLFQTESYVSKKLNISVTDDLILVLKLNQKYLDDIYKKQNMLYIAVSLIVLFLAFISIYFVSKIVQELTFSLDKSEKLNKKLQNVNIKLNSILNTSKDGISIINIGGEFIFLNNSYEQITGYTKEELQKKGHIALLSKKDQEKTLHNMQKVIKNEYIHNDEVVCITKDGKNRTLLVSMAKLPNKEQILVISRDITSIKAQENKLETQEEILMQQAKLASMGEMLENVAQQWREPISIITTSATGLKVQKEYALLTDEVLVKGLDSIVSHAEYLSRTIDDFRDFFKKEKVKRYFKISSAIEKCLFLVSSKISNQDIKLIVNCEDEEVLSFKNELVEVLINIVSNAVDAFDNKKIEHKVIQIDVSVLEQSITIDIHDNAGGIPLSIINQVFNRDFTTKKDKDGTGVGLYMAKEMMQTTIGGEMTVSNKTLRYENASFNGACFRLVIPKA